VLFRSTTLALYQDIFSPLFIPLPTGERGRVRGEKFKEERR